MTVMPPPPRENPYVGPRSFRPREKLYGREDEAARLFDLLSAERIVLLYSPSGAGKSSLINTLLMQKLAESDFNVLPILRVNAEPPPDLKPAPTFNRYVYSVLMSLEETRPEAQRVERARLVELKLDGYLNAFFPLTDGRSQFLIFDQFEELLTLDPTDRDAKIQFLNQAGLALRNRERWALFAMREDFLAGLDPYLRLIPTRLATRFRLDLLDLNSAAQAIRLPAKDQGVEIQEDAVYKLVEDLSRVKLQQFDGSTVEQPGLYVEPVQLQVVCRRLWDQLNPADQSISAGDVSAVGDADTALAGYYADQVVQVAAAGGVSERRIREWIESKLISSQGIRTQVLRDKDASEGLPNPVIDGLVTAYLVRTEKRGGATWYELAHDRLVRPVRTDNAAWFEKNLNVLQRRAALWHTQREPDGLLLRDPALLEAERWANANRADLTDVESEFLDRSRQARRRLRRERQVNLLVRSLAIIASLVSIVAVYLFVQARQAMLLSNARELAAAAISNLTVDPERSILLALRANLVNQELPNQDAAPEVADALHRSLNALRVEQKFAIPGDPVPLSALNYSPDGERLAAVSSAGKLAVWQAAARQLVYQINDPTGFDAVRFSPDGQHLAVGLGDGQVLIRTAADGDEVARLNGHTGPVWSVFFSPNGRWLASAGADGSARIWTVADWRPRLTLSTGRKGLQSVTFSPDSRWIATGGEDSLVNLWDAETGALLATLQGHSQIVNALDFSPDGRYLASASADATVAIWEVETRRKLRLLYGHTDWVYAVAFSPDGKYLGTASADRTARLWEFETGREIAHFVGHTDQVYDLEFTRAGDAFTSASADGTLRVWNLSLSAGHELFTRDLNAKVYSLDYSPDGQRLAAGTSDGRVRIWDARSGDAQFEIQLPNKDVTGLQFSPDGQRLAISGGATGTVYLWDLASNRNLHSLVTGPAFLYAMAFNAGGARLAAANGDGQVVVWDTTSGAEVLRAASTDHQILHLDYDPLGRWLAGACDDQVVRIWDAQTARLLLTLEGHTDIVDSAHFNADGTRLVSTSADGSAIIWKLSAAGAELSASRMVTLQGHIGKVFNAAFSPDGKTVATAGVDATVRLFEVATGEEKLALSAHTGQVYAVSFSPDGKYLASSSADGTLRVAILDLEELVRTARQRLTRSWLQSECKKYLYVDRCP